MTVIAVRDGVLAVDSAIGGNGICNGRIAKWVEVHERHGGGYMAHAGTAAPGQAFVRSYESGADPMEKPDDDGVYVLWLRADGSVAEWASGWLDYEAEFYAIGSGEAAALGAMAAGASADDAARIACRFHDGCSEPIDVMRV